MMSGIAWYERIVAIRAPGNVKASMTGMRARAWQRNGMWRASTHGGVKAADEMVAIKGR